MIKPSDKLYATNFKELKSQDSVWRLKLDSNENIYGVSEIVSRTLKNFNPQDISFYPSSKKLTEKLANRFNFDNEEVLLTNGTYNAFSLIINTYLDDNCNVVCYNHQNLKLYSLIKYSGAKLNLIEYDEDLRFYPDKIQNNITSDTKLVLLSNPDTLTGEFLSLNAIENLLKTNKNTLIVLDCSYINFSECGVLEDYYDLAKKYDNFLVLKSFSHDYALSGLKIAYIASNRENIKNIMKMTPDFNVNSLAIACATSALVDEKRLDEINKLNSEARKVLRDGLENLGYKPFSSETNFVLCDFGKHKDFCYRKLKNYGVIVKKFQRNSVYASFLSITVPKLSGVKFILEVLKKKDVLIFDCDGVVFDVRDSYLTAISKTYTYFTKKQIAKEKISQLKTRSNFNCNWNIVKYLLDEENLNIDFTEIIPVFQDLFYNSKNKEKEYLIDKEKLLISKETFEKLSQNYDLVMFTGRLKDEVKYSLKKYEIDKFFHYLITSDDLPRNMLKPNPKGVLEILEHCPYNSIRYLGNSVDDIISGNSAQVETIGVVNDSENEAVLINNFKHLRAHHILKDSSEIANYLKP